jgi:hypothetical protein
VYLATERHARVVAHVDAYGGVSAGDDLTMFIDVSRVHFFAADSDGQRIASNRTRDANGLPI